MTNIKKIDGVCYNDCSIELISTENEANFHMIGDILGYTETKNNNPFANQYHLYITSKEEIKLGDWFYNSFVNLIQQATEEILSGVVNPNKDGSRKIIASTDESLKRKENCIQCEGTGETTFSGTYTTQKVCDVCNGKKTMNFKFLPKPHKKFIEEYVKNYCSGNIMTSVYVEYDYEDVASWARNEDDTYDCLTCGKEEFDRGDDCNCEYYTLVINPENNTISTLVIDDKVYTRDDMVRAYTQGAKDYCKTLNTYQAFTREELPKWIKENL